MIWTVFSLASIFKLYEFKGLWENFLKIIETEKKIS